MERINASARMVVPLSVRIYGFGSGGSVVGSVLFFLRFFSLLPCCPLPLLSLLPLERWRANLSYNVRVIIM